GDVARCVGLTLGSCRVAVRHSRPFGLVDEDLVLAVAVGRLLPGDPGTWLGRIGGRPAGHRRVLSVLVGVDVQRRDVRSGAVVAPALTAEDPLALVRVAGVVEATGEHVVVVKAGAGRVFVPGRPRNGPARAGEVDRRRLTILALIEIQRSRELRARARVAAEGAVAARGPGTVRERA